MSDYLGNLLARTFAPNLGVRPRVASMFESPPGSLVREDLPELEETARIQTPPAPPKKTPPVSSEMIKLEEPAVSQPNSRYDISKGDFAPPASTAIDHAVDVQTDANSDQKSAPAADTGLNQLPSEAPSSQVTGSLAAVRPVAHPTLGAERKLSPAPPTQIRQVDKIEARVQHNGEPGTMLPKQERDDISNRNAPLAPAAAPKGMVIRPVRPAREENSFPAAVFTRREATRLPANSVSAPPPTIQVTIGRVEIRAVSPAPTPQRARPKSANVLSLEEYLRRRASGGSR